MNISKKEIIHIASLARIRLTLAEEEGYKKDLSAILGFVEKLNETDTNNVALETNGITLENAARKDEQIDQTLEEKSHELINAYPDQKNGWLKVKSVFNAS